MAKASVAVAAMVKPGDLCITRRANRTSCSSACIRWPPGGMIPRTPIVRSVSRAEPFPKPAFLPCNFVKKKQIAQIGERLTEVCVSSFTCQCPFVNMSDPRDLLESPPCVGRWTGCCSGILDEMARVLAAPTPWPVRHLRVRGRSRRRVPGSGPVWGSDPGGKAPGHSGRARHATRHRGILLRAQ